jgi:integrase
MHQPPTFTALLDAQQRLVDIGELPLNTAANRAAALRQFLVYLHTPPDELIGQELRSQFRDKAHAWAEHLRATGRSERNISNTLSALRSWAKMLIVIDTDRARTMDDLTPFNRAVAELMRGHKVSRVSALTGIPVGMLTGWKRDKKRPRLSNRRYIARLESHFKVECGSLVRLAGFDGDKYLRPRVGEPVHVAYRTNLAEMTKHHVLFRPSIDSPLRAQWRDFVRYKTDLAPNLERSANGVWRIAQVPFTPALPSLWFRFIDGQEVPSAPMAWHRTAAYLGFLALPVDQGGCGIPPDELETMAWLAVPDHLDAFIRHRIARCRGVANNYILEFSALIANLTAERTGWLRQQPHLQSTLPARFHRLNWDTMCEQALRAITAIRRALRHNIAQTRNPFDPLADIIALPKPLEALVDMVQRMRAARPTYNGNCTEAVWGRDIALIKLLISNPLRRKNMAQLTWRADQTGQLYQRADGSWWIRIPRRMFKNARSSATKNDYDMPVQQAVWSDLERYLFVYRPRLLRCATDYVFVPRLRSKDRPDLQARPWADISGRVEDLTREYLWRCPGVGMHAFRHLVATALIKASGHSDFKTAALVLHDKLETVEAHYAHLRSSDGAQRFTELLGNTLSKM